MSKKKEMKIAQKESQKAAEKVNQKIDELGVYAGVLNDNLNEIQSLFDIIRNVPSEKRNEYEKIKKVRLKWLDLANTIEARYKKAQIGEVVGIAAGTTLLTTAMSRGFATTSGLTLLETISSPVAGVAATNAALAWLGGGALAAGGVGAGMGAGIGAGVFAGEMLPMALAGPVGWAIAGTAIIGNGILLLKNKNEQNRLQEIFTLISKRDVKFYNLALVELNERIVRINEESRKLVEAISRTKSFGTDYNMMTEHQQYELISYVNLMNASTQLLVNPVIGLKPKVDKPELKLFTYKKRLTTEEKEIITKYESLVIYLSNLLYSITLDEKDRDVLCKALKHNKQFLESSGIKKKDFNQAIIDVACRVAASK